MLIIAKYGSHNHGADRIVCAPEQAPIAKNTRQRSHSHVRDGQAGIHKLKPQAAKLTFSANWEADPVKGVASVAYPATKRAFKIVANASHSHLDCGGLAAATADS